MRLLYAAYLLGLLLFPGHSWSQSYSFKNYQVTDGLSSNTITTIMQDSKGFMWFATRNGLNRFDGRQFRTFQNNAGDSLSLGNNSVYSVHEGRNGQLWIGTYKGIYIYHPELENFTRFKPAPLGEVPFIVGDSANVWMLVDKQLYRYDIRMDALISVPIKGVRFNFLKRLDDGSIWAASESGPLKEYDASSDTWKDHVINIPGIAWRNNEVTDICRVNDSILLLGNRRVALYFNIRTNIATNVFKDRQDIGAIQIHKIIRQSDNEFWLGTESGLYILNIRTGLQTILKKGSGNPFSLTDNVIRTLFKDAEENIWIGTFFGGINLYSRQYDQFRKYISFPGGLSGNAVHEICDDKFGNLWVGTEDAGLNRIDERTGQIEHFTPGGPGTVSYHNIHGLLADDNYLWIGTYEHGLNVMDLRTKKVVRRYKAGGGPHDLKSDFIVSMYKTRKGEILVGTWSGLFQYNRRTDDFSPAAWFNMQVQAIHEAGSGKIWVASYGNGVTCYDPATDKKISLRSVPGDSNSLINDYVNNLFEDSHGNMWFCTEAGLCSYSPGKGTMVRYTKTNGLPDNQIFRVLEDSSGTLWISTANGLVAFEPKLRHIKVYTTADGLLINQFNYNSAFMRKDGTFYFGSVKGMISFNPYSFVRSSFVPPVYVTGIQVNNSELGFRESNSLLKRSVLYTREIELPYYKSNISIDAAALSYAMPESNMYSYRMDGYEKNSTVLRTNRRIFYTKLPPGHYTFTVHAARSGGSWDKNGAVLKITITPPVWATVWAYVLYALVTAGILYTILRYYFLAIKEKNKRKIAELEIQKEREIYQAKIEFFTNIAHEIRTPLTLIKMPLDKLMKRVSDDMDIKESLSMMKKNTNRLIDLTNQLLDFRKAESDRFTLSFNNLFINDLLNEVFMDLKAAADEKELLYTLESPRLPLQVSADTEAMRKILMNVLHNAVKYADKKVFVKLMPFSSEDQHFTIEIKNDGYIIPQTLKEKIFEPFYRIKQTEQHPGTGIGLPLSRSLAELHHGKLFLKEGDEAMNTFVLSVPIMQEQAERVAFVAGDPSKVQEEPGSGGDFPAGRPSLLIVEDNKEIIQFISRELSEEYNILRAFNGKEALALLHRENVQLIISDIMMPVMDGIALCRAVKTDLHHSHIPIILLTAKNTVTSKIEGLEVGADAYIEKPFDMEHLQAQISNLLTSRAHLREYFAHSHLTHLKGIANTKADHHFLEDLNRIINEHITSGEIDVDMLAKKMNMSRPTFYRKIKALSDLSPHELITLSRLKKAAEMLAEGTHRINEVATAVGYTLQSNFARDFHKQFGESPSAYLARLKGDRAR